MANPAKPPAPSPPPDQQAGMKELTGLLLEVLRNVNHEVGTPSEASSRPELSGGAKNAFDHFRVIARSLRTPADGTETFDPVTRAGKSPPR